MKDVIIFGAGVAGLQAKRDIGENRDFRVKYFCDNSTQKQGKIIEGIPVISVDEAIEKAENGDYNGYILLSSYAKRRGSAGIIEQIKGTRLADHVLGISMPYIKRVYEGNPEQGNIRQEIYEIDATKPILDSYQYHVAHHCNLNCKACGHRSNVASPEFGDFEQYKKDIYRLSELFCTVKTVQLLGGEPLLNVKLPDFIYLSREVFPLAEILIWTNGLLIPDIGGAVFEAVKACRAKFIITQYPPTHHIIQEIQNKCEEENVLYEISDLVTEFDLSMRDEAGTKTPLVNYNECPSNSCHFLMDGKLSMCVFPLIYQKFRETYREKFEFTNVDIIDLYDKEIDGFKINEIFSGPIPACKYCNREFAKSIKWEGNYKKLCY